MVIDLFFFYKIPCCCDSATNLSDSADAKHWCTSPTSSTPRHLHSNSLLCMQVLPSEPTTQVQHQRAAHLPAAAQTAVPKHWATFLLHANPRTNKMALESPKYSLAAKLASPSTHMLISQCQPCTCAIAQQRESRCSIKHISKLCCCCPTHCGAVSLFPTTSTAARQGCQALAFNIQ